MTVFAAKRREILLLFLAVSPRKWLAVLLLNFHVMRTYIRQVSDSVALWDTCLYSAARNLSNFKTQWICLGCMAKRKAVIFWRFFPNCIMQTCPYDIDPFTPHFYKVKLWFTGVFIFFIFALKHRLRVLIRTA